MNHVVDRIAAAAVPPNIGVKVKPPGYKRHSQCLNSHRLMEKARETADSRADLENREEERQIYRGRVVGMLRRYMRYSIETGRLPSVLGSEFFRSRVTSYTMVTFEDRVIFVHDMEKCLERLDDFSQQLLARNILQEHDQVATSRLLHCSERTVRNFVPIALDLLAEILLDVGLLERIEGVARPCQDAASGEIGVTDVEEEKYKI